MKSVLLAAIVLLTGSTSSADVNIEFKLESLGLQEYICNVTSATSPKYPYVLPVTVFANDDIDATKLVLLRLGATTQKTPAGPKLMVDTKFSGKSYELLLDIDCKRK